MSRELVMTSGGEGTGQSVISGLFLYTFGFAGHALAQNWFYRGLKVMPPVKAGLDRDDVQKNLAAALRSFEPKHEHKMAGVAYLMSLWLEDKEASTLMSYTDVKT